MSQSRTRRLENRKRRIDRRLRNRNWVDQAGPVLGARNIHYELSDRTRGFSSGGIGAIHLLARRTGLIDEIDARLRLLKVHLPYHESDHVLNIAYNILCGGSRLEDIELRRNDEVYLDALNAERIPDPTTEGDFCRRFDTTSVHALMDIINDVRVRVWQQQPDSFFDEAIVDVDGSIAPTTGECKEGMDMSYKGEWGYAPLIVSLANTQEPLYLVNRGGNRPSHDGAARYLSMAGDLCDRAGFRRVLYRGDTDFSQTEHLDGWDREGRRFIFGINAMKSLIARAENLPKNRWESLDRAARYEVKTRPRQRPDNVKQRIVREREYKNIRLQSEQVAEFAHQPTACSKTYRVVVIRKNLSVDQGEKVLFDDIRYFFYITNDPRPAAEIVFQANDRCNQENLIEQLKNGVNALQMPVNNLMSNWAYMIMASLAWTLKAWFGLSLPEGGRWKEKHGAEKRNVITMEFKTFLNAFMRLPAQIVKTGRRIVYRLLAWNPYQHVFLRAVDAVSRPMRC